MAWRGWTSPAPAKCREKVASYCRAATTPAPIHYKFPHTVLNDSPTDSAGTALALHYSTALALSLLVSVTGTKKKTGQGPACYWSHGCIPHTISQLRAKQGGAVCAMYIPHHHSFVPDRQQRLHTIIHCQTNPHHSDVAQVRHREIHQKCFRLKFMTVSSKPPKIRDNSRFTRAI